MTLNVDIYEMDYSCSPGGVNCWEMTIQHYGSSENYSDFKTAGDALNYVLDKYPKQELELNVKSLDWYFEEYDMADELN